MKPKVIVSALCALTLTAMFSAVALSQRSSSRISAIDGEKKFEVRGRIIEVDVAGKRVRIAHEAIPDFMPAMTMPFVVKDASLLKGLAEGANVQFTLIVTGDDSWIDRLRVDLSGKPVAAEIANKTPASLSDREAERVQTGELVPDFKLMNQDGRTIRLSDFRGKAVVLTFIYTRCPLPNFCPLMSKNFSQLQQRLSGKFENKFQLLSVSIDPEFDRTEVLKEYAGRYGANTKDWNFATGDGEQIAFVAGLMGLYYARENGLISHDLRTALIGPDGRLVHLWKSNVWTPYEVQRMVCEVLTGSKDITTR